MPSSLDHFEAIARASARLEEKELAAETPLPHAFETRNIHQGLPVKVKRLFDDGHYAEATFHAFKYLDKQVQKHAGVVESGYKLMMSAFDDAKPACNSHRCRLKVKGMSRKGTVSSSQAGSRQFATLVATNMPSLMILTCALTI